MYALLSSISQMNSNDPSKSPHLFAIIHPLELELLISLSNAETTTTVL